MCAGPGAAWTGLTDLPHRDESALQTVLERQTGAEVRDEGQRGDHLGGTGLFSPRKRLGHGATVHTARTDVGGERPQDGGVHGGVQPP
jgi:hypothetical protein